MCIRDRPEAVAEAALAAIADADDDPRPLRAFRAVNRADAPVSYTHPTLPTSGLVEISVVAVSFKKKEIVFHR